MTRTQGHVLQRSTRGGQRYALRFTAYGERRYLTLGTKDDGWTRARAERELARILDDVRRNAWEPPGHYDLPLQANPPPRQARFGAFADEWLAARQLEIAPATYRYEQWALRLHLLPRFADMQLAEITVREVDAYRHHKLEQAARRRQTAADHPERDGHRQPRRPLSASSINKTIDVLQSILEIALEYDLIQRNPARGRRRRAKTPFVPPVYLDRVEHITALLDAAEHLDACPRWLSNDRHAIIATLLLAGPRSHELRELTWRDVDLDRRRIRIRRAKTPAGHREITILPRLHRILAAHRGRATCHDPGALAFPTRAGTSYNKDNLRGRSLAHAVCHADRFLAGANLPPLPHGLSPHSLRHTYASILVACGENPVTVMAQLGHSDPAFTLRVYAHAVQHHTDEHRLLHAYVNDRRTASA